MLNLLVSLLLTVATTAGSAAPEELSLIQSTLSTLTDPAGGSGRPIDRRPLVADQTFSPDASLNELVRMAITRSMAASPKEAAATCEAFRRANEVPMEIGGLSLREGSAFISVRPERAGRALSEHPDRQGLLIVSRPAISPDGRRAFVAVIEVERELRATYVQEYRRDAGGAWKIFQSWGAPVASSVR
jgi:hypothetical protein